MPTIHDCSYQSTQVEKMFREIKPDINVDVIIRYDEPVIKLKFTEADLELSMLFDPNNKYELYRIHLSNEILFGIGEFQVSNDLVLDTDNFSEAASKSAASCLMLAANLANLNNPSLIKLVKHMEQIIYELWIAELS